MTRPSKGHCIYNCDIGIHTYMYIKQENRKCIKKINAIFAQYLAFFWGEGGFYHHFKTLKPVTHRRRRRDETVESRRVGVGGVNTIRDDCRRIRLTILKLTKQTP